MRKESEAMTIENLKGLKEAIQNRINYLEKHGIQRTDITLIYLNLCLYLIEEFEAELRKKLKHYENAYAPPPYKLSITLDARKDELRKILGDEGAGTG